MKALKFVTRARGRNRSVSGIVLLLMNLLISACSGGSKADPVTPTTNPVALNSNAGVYRANSQRTGDYGPINLGQENQLIWKHSFDGLEPSPAVLSGDGVYFRADGNLLELDAKTGTQKWQTSASSDFIPTVVGGVLYYEYKKELYALDEKSKQPKWVFPTGSVWTEYMVTDSAIYAGTGDGNVLAIDIANGTPKQTWMYKADDTIGGLYRPDVAIQNKTVFITSSTITTPGTDAATFADTIHAFDADTGVELWLFKPTGNVKSMSVSGNRLFAATNSLAPTPSYIYALDTTTGKQLWQKELGFTIWAPLSTTQGLILIGGKTGIAEALDITTQQTEWKFQAQDAIGGISIAGNSVYIGSDDHNLYCVDQASGQVRSTLSVDGVIWDMPVVTENGIYFLDDRNVYAFR
jgi:eukaryotic-like serine/threonine-protein kinase